ncbi:kinase-like domain-containing protein, partial [Mycena rebaudengoi]
LFGVDGTTFPGLAMAMVSPWMQQGNVLNYMAQHSPSSQYAIALVCAHFFCSSTSKLRVQLNDAIQDLMYLHSENIVHGDLCARNILMHKHRARLTDFGLAAFIESDTSKKSSTRGGSTRWMAPELLLPDEYQPGALFKRTPASDVWAFGCVCCEIWTEGQVPFEYMSEGAIISAFSKIDAAGALPYEITPFDKAGTPMPDRLWELVQRCFRYEAAMRPTVRTIADFLSEMKRKPSPTQPTSSPTSVDAATLQPGELSTDPALNNHPTIRNIEALASAIPMEGNQMHETELVTVRFGPVNLDGVDHEKLFHELLVGILAAIRQDALVLPVVVDKCDSHHLDLRFRSVLEAHNFVLTWQAYREEAHQDVLAVLV